MGCHFTMIGCNDKSSRYHSPIIKQWSQDKQSLEKQSLHSRLVMVDIPGGSTKAPNSIMLSVKGCAEDMTSKRLGGGSLVAQWERIYLSVQGTQVRSLIQYDSTCWGAAMPMRHNS